MNNALVSVIIPVFNARLYLRESIDSALNQTYANIEIIIVNDGSTDGSLELLQEVYGYEPKVKILTGENHGQSSACNLGFANSTGDYIKFLDSDDIINLHFIEAQMKLIGGSTTMISSASWGRFYNNDLSTFRLNYESVWRDMKPIDWIVESLENGSNMMQCALWLIPREVLLKSGLWNERLSLNNDFDFIVRVLLAASAIKYSKESTLYYRSGMNNSLSQRRSAKAWESGVNSNMWGVENILAFENSPRTRYACGKNLCYWLFQTYYPYPALSKPIEKKIKEMEFIIVYGARPMTKMISRVVGWKFLLWLKFKVRLAP
ncbi:MAG: glycosyltransferase [Bacteroidetes bacterium]|nr:glycosyltransferase [Bacteroidota bacterium]